VNSEGGLDIPALADGEGAVVAGGGPAGLDCCGGFPPPPTPPPIMAPSIDEMSSPPDALGLVMRLVRVLVRLNQNIDPARAKIRRTSGPTLIEPRYL